MLCPALDGISCLDGQSCTPTLSRPIMFLLAFCVTSLRHLDRLLVCLPLLDLGDDVLIGLTT